MLPRPTVGWYNDRNNFMPLCSGKMKGETQTLSGNIYLFPQWQTNCVHVMGGMLPSEAFVFENNTCVNSGPEVYSGKFPLSTAKTGGNRYFVAGGDHPNSVTNFPCSRCNWASWKASGQDVGSTVANGPPNASVMIGWGRDLLGIPTPAYASGSSD